MNFKNKKHLEIFIFIPFISIGLFSIYIFNSKITSFQEKKTIMQNLNYGIEATPKKLISENGKTEKIDIEINDTSINPEVIEVDRGSKVILGVKVIEGYHDLYIDGYKIKTSNISTNKMEKLIFIASQSGNFIISSRMDKYLKLPSSSLLIVK